MAINNLSNMLNTKFRMSGLASGLDTESIVQSMLKVEQYKIDRVKQDKQILEWRRDDYRSITNLLRNFKDEFFDVLKPSTNFRSPSAFASFSATNVNSADSSKVTATAGTGAVPGQHAIDVTTLAKGASIAGTANISKAATSVNAVTDLNLQGKQINVTLDGVTKAIDLANYTSLNGVGDPTSLVSKLKESLNTAFGAGKFDVTESGGKLTIAATGNGSTFSIASAPNNYITSLGFTDAQKNFVTGTTDAYTTDFSAYNGGKFKITYDGTEYTAVIGRAPTSVADLASAVQDAVNSAIGGAAGQVKVSATGNKLTFTSATGKSMAVSPAADTNVLNKMGFGFGASATGTSSMNITSFTANEQGKTFIINDGTSDYTVTIDNDIANITDLANEINSDLSAHGINVSVSGDKLVFASDKTITFKKGPADGAASLGFSTTAPTSNRLSLTSSLSSIKDTLSTPLTYGNATDTVKFTINNVEINVGKTYENATMRDVMNAVNSSAANVTMQYDSINDKFTIVSKETGSASQVNVSDPAGGNLMTAIGIIGGATEAGTDAAFKLDGVNMTRSANEFAINGVTYNLKATGATTINVNADPDALMTKIKDFVTKYNEVISKINGEVSEKRSSDYLPLTDEQRSAMKEDDIKKWEEKAKSGMLYNDGIISSIAYNMRKALADPITGGPTSLAKIGITTGPYSMKGMLVIDETKLRAAIVENPDSVAQLFTQESTVSYEEGLTDSTKRQTRYENSGIAQRLYDILQDNIRTTRDSKGYKGTLLEKAGITGDISEFKNTIATSMNAKDTLIDTLLTRMQDKESRLYRKFAALERTLGEMNNQSAWLSQQTGGGQ